ncbi:MAG: cation:proton antiporter [Paracoccaceae bacterium]
MPEDFFGLAPYHYAFGTAGLAIILAHWLPRLVSTREPAAAPLMLIFGAGLTLLFPQGAILPDPRTDPLLWERVSEAVVIIALFGTGLRLDRLLPLSRWGTTTRLLLVAMPLTIAALAFAGAQIAGLTLASAVLLGAVMAPTDPVLAGDVQVAPPQQGQETPIRFALTTEAGLNDGLAFPFVYMALAIAAMGPTGWWVEWLTFDVGWRIAVGTVFGVVWGWLLGQVLFRWPRASALAETRSGIVSIAAIVLCYGTCELLEGYGFIAVVVMGAALRRVEREHDFHLELHTFSEAIEHALTAILLVALGSLLPRILADATWSHLAVALLLVLVIRPALGWLALAGCALRPIERRVVAVYGVRGIGSIYYLAYALGKDEFAGIDALWSIAALTILVSTVLHGFTVAWAMSRVNASYDESDRDPSRDAAQPARSRG